MMEQGRKLKVLVIHDTHFYPEIALSILGTDELSLSVLTFKNGRTTRVLKNWVEVISVLGSLSGTDAGCATSIETPDILLIDCHFKEDKDSPKLHREDNNALDPRGLLYGAVLAAHFLGVCPRRPFTFLPYSMSMSLAAKDPYAQTFYSLLCAMHDPSPNIIEAAHYSRLMAATPSSETPDRVWGSALEQYRQSLLVSLETILEPEIDSFERGLTAVDAFISSGEPLPDDISISWSDSRGKRECVLLRSLFADCRMSRQWIRNEEQRIETGALGSVTGKAVLNFLRPIVNGKSYVRDIYYPVKDIMEGFTADSTIKADWGRGLEEKQRRVLALTIAWARDRCESNWNHHNPSKLNILEGQIGGLQASQVNRALGVVLGVVTGKERRAQGREFIRALDSSSEWLFPDWLRRMTIRYLKEIYEHDMQDAKEAKRRLNFPHFAAEYWPKCLK